jgi:hypothetical protein
MAFQGSLTGTAAVTVRGVQARRSRARGSAAACLAAVAISILPVEQAAGTQAASRLRCPPREARLLAHDRILRVYQHSDTAPLFGLPVTACVIGRPVGMTLIGVPPRERRRGRVLVGRLGKLVLAGPVVAYVVDRLTGVDTASSELVVADVATRRILRSAPAGYSVDAGFVAFQTLTALAVTSGGAVAWEEERRGPGESGVTVSVHAAPPKGPVALLDEGPAIDAASLSLSGGTVTWTHAGIRRSAAMP